TDGLHDDGVESEAAEETDHEINVWRDTRTTTRRGHAPDEHRIVGRPVRHADAVAEQGPAGEGTLRIACQDRDRPPRPPDHLAELPDQCALSHSAAARDGNNPRLTARSVRGLAFFLPAPRWEEGLGIIGRGGPRKPAAVRLRAFPS